MLLNSAKIAYIAEFRIGFQRLTPVPNLRPPALGEIVVQIPHKSKEKTTKIVQKTLKFVNLQFLGYRFYLPIQTSSANPSLPIKSQKVMLNVRK